MKRDHSAGELVLLIVLALLGPLVWVTLFLRWRWHQVAARHGVATPCALPRIPFRRNVIALASVLCLQFLFAGLLYWLVEWQGIWVGGV